MESPTSTLRRRTRRAAVAVLAVALPLAGATAHSAAAQPAAPALPALPSDPGDSGKFAKLNAQISKLDKAYGGDLAKLRDAQYAAKKALQKSSSLQGDLNDARSLVAQMAATQYMTDGQGPTISMLASGDPSDMLSGYTLIEHLSQNKSAKVAQIGKLVDEQAKARTQAQQKISELQKEIKDLSAQKKRIETLVKKYKPQSPSVGMGGVTPRMMNVKTVIDQEEGPFPTIGCVRTTGDPQDHGTGHACDFMVTTGGVMATGSAKAHGDATAAYAIAHASALGIKYIIWRQRIYDLRSPGWRMMENRGGVTANHFDHVHISVF
ncbi:coiled-coil domain-containing protein [Actinomadura sp. NTSP31]|uniref:coiled-coil domain-containing protein n=1 Tax=Actinomadura sp. NTSP31 TaxID=1735447 RepID=UPI0035C032CE